MIWPTVAILASAVALASAVLRWYANRRLQDVQRAEKHRNGFFEAAERVIADERTPSHLAAFVLRLSMGLSNRLLPYFLLAWPGGAPKKVRKDVRKVWREMADLPDDLRRDVGALRYHGLMAIALQSTLVGRRLANRIDSSHLPRDRDQGQDDGDNTLFDRAAIYQNWFPNRDLEGQLAATR